MMIKKIFRYRMFVTLLAVSCILLVLFALAQLFDTPLTLRRQIRPSADMTLIAMQRTGELTTLQVRVEKVVEAESNATWNDIVLPELLFGDKLLLVATGEARFGLDLRALDAGAIEVGREDGRDMVRIALPPVGLLDLKLDQEETRIYDRETGFFRPRPDSELETEARKAAVAALEEQVQEQELYIEQAEDSARELITNLLQGLGFEEIVFL